MEYLAVPWPSVSFYLAFTPENPELSAALGVYGKKGPKSRCRAVAPSSQVLQLRAWR